MHRLLIDTAPRGYEIRFEKDGKTVARSRGIYSIRKALATALFYAIEIEKAVGVYIEPLICGEAIRKNRHRDVDAAKLWSYHMSEIQPPFVG